MVFAACHGDPSAAWHTCPQSLIWLVLVRQLAESPLQYTNKCVRFVALSALSLGVGLRAGPARACGGLFCSAAAPVNQAAERIVFAQNTAAHRITAVIEILYEGPAESFAWILPVPGTPEVGVSTNAILNRLQQATNPNFRLRRSWANGGCNGGFPSSASAGAAGSGSSGPGVEEGGSVSVLASGTAGPYDYEVIDVADDVVGDPAREAIDWLVANGYDTGATGPDVLRPYLEAQLNLVAIKLTKRASVGSIRPIKISYDGDLPMIPIRPTAVAANDDMGVLVWVLGPARAVPFNYKSLELNHALLDWFNPQSTYNALVTAAANETGDGQGFVTEDARPTLDASGNAFSEQLYSEGFNVQAFRSLADSWSSAQAIVELVDRFSGFYGNFALSGPFAGASAAGRVSLDGVADALARNLTLPSGTTIDQVLAAPRCFFEELRMDGAFYCEGQRTPAAIDLTSFDRTAFFTDVEALVFEPMESTVQLFVEHPYMTRFYTTLSASEMTVDPLFAFNPDLLDVSSVHDSSLTYSSGCNGQVDGPWQAEVDGRLVKGEGTTWPLTLANREQDMPVNARILQLSTSGSGAVYEDNEDAIDRLLQSQFGSGSGAGTGAPPLQMHSSGACSFGGRAGSTQPIHAAWLLAGWVLWAWRRPRSARGSGLSPRQPTPAGVKGG